MYLDSDNNTHYLTLGTFVLGTIHPRKHESHAQRKSRPAKVLSVVRMPLSNFKLKYTCLFYKCYCKGFSFMTRQWKQMKCIHRSKTKETLNDQSLKIFVLPSQRGGNEVLDPTTLTLLLQLNY